MKRLPHAHERGADGVLVRGFISLEDARRLRHAAEERHREDQPPHAHADKRQLDAGDGVGNAECRWHQDPQQVDDEQDAAAEVADGVARRGYAVHLLRRGDVRQQRVVEDEARGDGDVRDHEQQRRVRPLAAPDRPHHHRRDDADADKQREHRFFDRAIVRNRAKDRPEHCSDRHRNRCRPRKPRGGDRRRQSRGGERAEERREDGGDDGRLKRGVRPVVHRPRAQLRAIETETIQEAQGLGLC